MGIRVVVIDDNPHVRWAGRVYPVNATFQHFVAALLDVPGEPVASIVSCVPLREATSPPVTLPLDPRIEVVGTTPFDGIAGFLRRAPAITRRNARILRPVIASADLVWIKVPASNALLAGWLAWRAGVPRFIWVAGSAAAVGKARFRGFERFAGWVVGVAYDAVGALVGIGGDRVIVGRSLLRGDGIVASLVQPEELNDPATRRWPKDPSLIRFVWAGRIVEGKGLRGLIRAVAAVARADPAREIELTLIGDGPARRAIEFNSTIAEPAAVRFLGYIGDRTTYLRNLAAADAFLFTSEAEGFPKVVLDAMAVGLPVLARPSGSLGELQGNAIQALGDLRKVVTALDSGEGGVTWESCSRAGHGFVAEHTMPAELRRLVMRWRARGLVELEQ